MMMLGLHECFFKIQCKHCRTMDWVAACRLISKMNLVFNSSSGLYVFKIELKDRDSLDQGGPYKI